MSTTNAWSAPPLIPGPWKDIAPSDALALATRIGAAMQALGSAESIWIAELQRLRAIRLNIYENWLLGEAEVLLPDASHGVANFLYGPGRRFVLLDHASATVHALNETELVPLSNQELVAEYVRFFCCHLTADAARFQIVESVDQLMFPPGLDPAAIPAVVQEIGPLRVSPVAQVHDEYTATVSGHLLFRNVLYRAQYLVSGDSVQMTADQPICTLPVRAELITGPLRILELGPYEG
jgi:hypothetical protein